MISSESSRNSLNGLSTVIHYRVCKVRRDTLETCINKNKHTHTSLICIFSYLCSNAEGVLYLDTKIKLNFPLRSKDRLQMWIGKVCSFSGFWRIWLFCFVFSYRVSGRFRVHTVHPAATELVLFSPGPTDHWTLSLE